MNNSDLVFDNPRDQLWWEIQDNISPAKFWPEMFLKLLWKKNLDHKDRPLICAFVIYNRLNPEVKLFY